MDGSPLNLEERSNVGGGKVKRLRKTGYIPAVVYGHGINSTPVQVKDSDFREFLASKGRNSIFSTEFAADQDFTVLVKDVEYDRLKHSISHVDFQKVSLFEKVHANVPVRIVGENKQKQDGSVIVHQLDEIAVECLPQHVPHYIDVDVSATASGHSITAGQLKLPGEVTLVTEPGSVIVSITSGKPDLQVSKPEEPAAASGEEGNVQAQRT